MMDHFCGLCAHPVLTPLYFFLWRYVKDIVYKTPVTSLNE
jgi:hypothetical protein